MPAQLNTPYTFEVFIEAYIYTLRNDFVHEDFPHYYNRLFRALQKEFGIEVSDRNLSREKSPLWGLLNNTIRSLLRISHPFSSYLEAGLVHKRLSETEKTGELVTDLMNRITTANSESETAHREMIRALFEELFGKVDIIVTSEQLRANGFEDSWEPKNYKYLDYY